MKLDVVNNEDGPLARSTFTSANHNRSDPNKKSLAELPRGVEDRLQNIEKHLNIEIGDCFFKKKKKFFLFYCFGITWIS